MSFLVSGCENLIQSRGLTFVAFQVRVAKAVMVVDWNRAVAIAVLDQKFYRGVGFRRVFDRPLQAAGIKCDSVDGNDLIPDSQSALIRRTFPDHVAEATLGGDGHA